MRLLFSTILILFLVCHYSILAQNPQKPKPTPKLEPKSNPQNHIYMIVDESAEPEGGMDAFYQFIANKLKYPADALEEEIEGKVFVDFIINEDGSFGAITVVKGLYESCDQEVMRVLQLASQAEDAPKWNSGKIDGKAVKQRLVIPINFNLKSKKTSSEEEILYIEEY